MTRPSTGALHTIRSTGADSAVVFLHGFSGRRDDTWGSFPGRVETQVPDRDLYTLGYSTTFHPDVVGIWSADPDLPILATMFRTEMEIAPLARYGKLTFIAHSMGGLIAQKAIVDSEPLRDRVEHLLLFGTPSAGLKKASWVFFWKRQLANMAHGSAFIEELREKWTERIGAKPRFEMRVIAGDRDQFVPPSSSLGPFDEGLHYVVPGDHLSIVKPDGPKHTSVRLTVSTLTAGAPPPPETRDPLMRAAEVSSANVERLVADRAAEPDAATIVLQALALERHGDRQASIALLERHQDRHTDIKGTLAGRIKRIWLESEASEDAERAFDLYADALEIAKSRKDPEQIYYHAINLAFLHFVAFDRPEAASKMARLASEHCLLAGDQDRYWNLATRAESRLYLGQPDEAIALYTRAKAMNVEDWQFSSAALQAGRIAIRLEAHDLADRIDRLFTPQASEPRLVFVSYAREDENWKDKLVQMLAPHLRKDETLKLWVDRDAIASGDEWLRKIEDGLERARVAVAIVSAPYLASDFVAERELPVMVRAADERRLTLLWIYASPAAYEQTDLARFQAAHDPRRPLSSLDQHERQETLKSIADKIAMARLSA